MKVIGYDLITNIPQLAVEDLKGEWVGYIARRSPIKDEEYETAAERLFPVKLEDIPEADCLITSAPYFQAKHIVSILKASKAKYLVWDLFTETSLQSLTLATVPIQILGWSLTIVKDSSPAPLGYNCSESRTWVLASRDLKDLLPTKMEIPIPARSLLSIWKTKNDPELIPVMGNNGQLFHKETRPWNLTGIVLDAWHVKVGGLSKKVGTLAYPIRVDNKVKLHRITASECAEMLGNPEWSEAIIKAACEDKDGLAVFMQLREPSFPLWKDIMRRFLT